MLTISRNTLKTALARVIPFASDDEARPVLECVYFEHLPGLLKVTAADGFRLCHAEIPTTSQDTFAALVKASDLLPFVKAKAGRKDYDIEIECYGRHLSIEGKGYEPRFGTYPDYMCIIPSTKSAKVEAVLPADFGQAARHMCSFWKHLEGANIVRWSLTPSGHVLSAYEEATGSTRWDMAGTVTCQKPLMLGINCKFLDMLCKVAEGCAVTVRAQVANSPIRFDFDNVTAVIMPMHLGNKFAPLTPFDLPAVAELNEQDRRANNAAYYAEQDRVKKYMATPKENEPAGANFYARPDDLDYPKADPKGTYEQELTGATCGVTTPKYGKGTPYIHLEFSQPVKVEKPQQNPDRYTKSELMTALNKLRAQIKRDTKGKPEAQKRLLAELYKAFGWSQMKNPPALPCDENWHIIARISMPAVIKEHRQAHDITPLIVKDTRSCPIETTSTIASRA